MRKRFEQQLELGGLSISEVEIDKRSRHELPQLLSGLQYIFITPSINTKIFELLEQKVTGDKNKTGRLGMSLWEILVLGVVRLNLNIDYDNLQDLANHHASVRGILGVHKLTSDWSSKKYYPLQTLKDNVRLLDEEILSQLNELVVDCGHTIKKTKEEEKEMIC